MGEKMKKLADLRFELARKWEVYYDNGGVTTPEVIHQMQEENRILAELGKEATKEWLEEKGRKDV